VSKLGSEGRSLVRTGAALLACAALAAGWELLARQAPGTPLFLGLLPGPISALRELCFSLGVTLALTGGLLAPAAGEAPRGERLVRIACGGATLGVAAQLYAASQGMHGVQLQDARPDALPLFVLRQGSVAASALALAIFGVRGLRSSGSAR